MIPSTGAELTIALGRYDRTEPLIGGRVRLAPEHRARFVTPPAEEMFAQAFDQGAFDASELSFSNFLRHSVAGTCRYIGLPVFPSRSFRHATLYVLNEGPFRGPADLRNARVGVREYSMTAALAARGALREQYGIDTASLRWIVGDVEGRERDVVPVPELHKPIDLGVAPEGRFLVDLLLEREIDVLLAYKPPKAFHGGAGQLRRLIPDVPVAEAEYFRRFGIFPIMHLVGLRRDHAETAPELGIDICRALTDATRLALADLDRVDALPIALPWAAAAREHTVAIMGEDYWPSGIAANRRTLSRMIDWSFEDGLIPAKPEVDDLFLPALRHS